MKFLFNIVFICFTGICISQTSAHVEIIKDTTPKHTSPLLTYTLNTPVFDTFNYSRELKQQQNTFSLVIESSETIRNDWFKLSPINISNSYFDDYRIAYKRSELERMLPQPPDLWDFCPSASN